jgi:Fanconi anemia group M protein
MKELHDIFQKRKSIFKEDKPKEDLPKIIVDYREKNSFVVSKLVKLGFDIEFKALKVADYLVKDVAIERKTVNDFISSMINRRLLIQLQELVQYENRLLMIEGIDEQELYTDSENRTGMHPNSIRGFLLSIVLKYKVPIIFTKNEEDTAKFIHVLSKRKSKELSLNVTKKALNKKEQLQFIIESFPGIGPKTAKKLLEKFKSIKNIANASEDELKEVLGKKGEIVKRLIDQEY